MDICSNISARTQTALTDRLARLRAPVAVVSTVLLVSMAALWPIQTFSQQNQAQQDLGQQQTLLEQRGLYLQAREAQASGRVSDAMALLPQLEGYPLRVYLEYEQLRPRLSTLASSDSDRQAVDDFLAQYRDSYLGNRLEREWVSALAAQNRWHEVLHYHRPGNTTTALTCQRLRAQLETGDRSALDVVEPLWNVNFSQPNDCDPVFEAWLAQDFLSAEIAWQRFSKIMQVRQLALARYVSRLLPERERSLAELFLRIDAQPEHVISDAALQRDAPEIRQIILHGIRRLAAVDAPQALEALNRHQARQSFSSAELNTTRQFIAQRLLLQGFVAQTEALLLQDSALNTETLVGWLLRDALRQQDWPRMFTWLQRLPEDARQSERWTYWQARTLEALDAAGVDHNETLLEAEQLYFKVSQTRSFYGFLAADRLGLPYELVDQPVAVSDADLLALHTIPAVARAHELYLIGEEVAARNEWSFATASMSPQQIISSGRLADSWGWHRNGIQAMIRAGYWDDLQLRFPLAYTDLFAEAADEHGVPSLLLMSVARQESAFMHDVRSSAGALGLMQLMPATGRETAGRLGMRINDQDLLRPDVNIRLGSRYLTQLLQDFDNNRALAAAAYNAGPNRVRQWLRQTAGNPVPLDVWIEIIPFAETRTYVQNVLAFSVIYAYRLDEPARFLTAEEADSRW